MTKDNKRCSECQTELEIYEEYTTLGYGGIPIWFCPTCKAACGELGR